MDNIVERGRLYDYYGGLLTEHQNLIYRAMVYDDMSLGEIAKEYNISRQGVHDLITRCDRQLKRYEEKLGLIERDMMIGSKLDKIEEIADGEQISDIVSQIRDLL
ncbi:MAG: DNA-binding protein [Lachnospiraceae bacterium]|nr:DNA-binding protein [Lachnospiraceae bacterium]